MDITASPRIFNLQLCIFGIPSLQEFQNDLKEFVDIRATQKRNMYVPWKVHTYDKICFHIYLMSAYSYRLRFVLAVFLGGC